MSSQSQAPSSVQRQCPYLKGADCTHPTCDCFNLAPVAPPASDAPAPPRESCPACEPGQTVIRVTLDRKCVECGRPVSDEPQRNSDQWLTIERARAKCLEVEQTWGASDVATMASLACFGALVLAEKSPWVRHHVDAIHALVDSVAHWKAIAEPPEARCTRCDVEWSKHGPPWTAGHGFTTLSAASPAQEATPPREQEQHQGWTKNDQPQEPTPEGESPVCPVCHYALSTHSFIPCRDV